MNRLLPVVALLVLSACGPPWRVIAQSGPPSLLTGATSLTMTTESGALLINGKTIEQVYAEEESFPEAVAAMEQGFLDGFARDAGVPVALAAGPPPPNQIMVVARFAIVDPGKYAFVYERDTLLTTRVLFVINGHIVDEIEITRRVTADITRPAIIQRMGIAGQLTGEVAARFFRHAASGGG